MIEKLLPESCFHPSIEGAQHGAKNLEQFLDFAYKNGAKGAQPSNFMLENVNGGFRDPKQIADLFRDKELILDGVSAHCPFWVHTTAWTGSRTILPFVPSKTVKNTTEAIESWAEGYIPRLLDLCAGLGVKIVPLFWGVAFGWVLATGYPWGFWNSTYYDL